MTATRPGSLSCCVGTPTMKNCWNTLSGPNSNTWALIDTTRNAIQKLLPNCGGSDRRRDFKSSGRPAARAVRGDLGLSAQCKHSCRLLLMCHSATREALYNWQHYVRRLICPHGLVPCCRELSRSLGDRRAAEVCEAYACVAKLG